MNTPITIAQAVEKYGVPKRRIRGWLAQGRIRRVGSLRHGVGRPFVLINEHDVRDLARETEQWGYSSP